MVNQVSREYQVWGTKMAAYLAKVKKELSPFECILVEQIPQEQNANADALAKLATFGEGETLGLVLVEFLERPSIKEARREVEMINTRPTWMTPIMEYLAIRKLPDNRKDARKILYQAPQYLIVDITLYQCGHSLPLPRCVLPKEAKTIL